MSSTSERTLKIQRLPSARRHFTIGSGYIMNGQAENGDELEKVGLRFSPISRVRRGPGNPEKYLNFSWAFSCTGKS